MREHRWGRIVSVSSVFAVDGMAGAAWYSAAKAALHGLTRSIAREAGPSGVLVNVVMPGLTMSERVAATVSEDVRARVRESTPLRRLLTPQDVAGDCFPWVRREHRDHR